MTELNLNSTEEVLSKTVTEHVKKKRGLFLVLFCLINFVTGALYVWSVFSGPLAEHFSRLSGVAIASSDLGPVFGLATGVTPLLMLAGGFVNDRMGPRLVIGTGGLLIAAGYLGTLFIEDPALLYLTYGIGVGAGTGLVNGCTISTAVKFFPERRGFAGGIVTASLGAGGAVWPLVAARAVESFGILATFGAFGAVSGAVITAAAAATEKCPDGFARTMCGGRHANGTSAAGGRANRNCLEMMRTPEFVPLFLLFTASATMGLMLLSNISDIARIQVGLSAASAALAVSTVSLANTAGRFLSGTLSDRIGRLPTLVATLVAALVGFGLLVAAGTGEAVSFFTGLACIGICFGAFIGTYPGLVADEYGPKHNGVNFSIMMLGYSIGGLVGPWLVRWAREAGSFDRAYAVCASGALFGIGCAILVLLLKRRALRAAHSL